MQYSNWSRGHIDRLAKFIRKRNSKCGESVPAPVVGEMPEEGEKEKKRRHHRHGRCHDQKINNFNLFKYMHDLANTEYGISKEETPIHAENAANSEKKPATTGAEPKKSYDVFEILSEITRPLGFELNVIPPATVGHGQPSASIDPQINKLSTPSEPINENVDNPMDAKVPTPNESISITEPEKPKRILIETVFDQPPIFKAAHDTHKEEIFESHSNNLASSIAVNTHESVTLQDDSDDSDKEWDVICEEIAAAKLENRQNSPPKSTGTIPKIPVDSITTKNSSTNTSFDDIPKNIESDTKKLTFTPPSTPRENVAGERNGNNVNFPNFEKLGRDLHKHIQEQMAETQAQQVIHHRSMI